MALTELSKKCKTPIDTACILAQLVNPGTAGKSLNLAICSYLLYYSERYQPAFNCFEWLIRNKQEPVLLYKLLSVHCKKELYDYKGARLFIVN